MQSPIVTTANPYKQSLISSLKTRGSNTIRPFDVAKYSNKNSRSPKSSQGKCSVSSPTGLKDDLHPSKTPVSDNSLSS